MCDGPVGRCCPRPVRTRGFYALMYALDHALDRPDEMEPSIYMDPVTYLYPNSLAPDLGTTHPQVA